MKEFFKNLLSKETALSSMRYAFIYTYVLSMTSFWSVWAVNSLRSSKLEDIPGTLWLCISSILAIVTVGKIWQTNQENKVNNEE